MEIAEQKKQLRKQMHAKRAALDMAKKHQYDEWMCESIWEIISERKYKSVHCYLPMSTEINITPLIQKMLDDGITVVSPKTLPKRKLQNRVLKSLRDVETGVFGTSHPSDTEEYFGKYDLIIVPGLAFNDSNYRLGYGGGYYDTFLAQNPEAYKLGVFYPFQHVQHVPQEAHDAQLDRIVVGNLP
jgi:5-formyltetrahydrofolate cyclo-ligase